MSIANIVTVITAILLTILILIQTRGASLGAGMGGSGDVNTVRRGSDKTLHNLTIILVIVFGLSLMAHVLG